MCNAQQAKQTFPVDLKLNGTKEYNGANGAIRWAIIGASSAAIGTAAYLAPEFDNKHFPSGTRVDKNQQLRYGIYKAVWPVMIFATSVSVIFATNDVIYYVSHKKSDKVSLNFAASPTSAALSLNFK